MDPTNDLSNNNDATNTPKTDDFSPAPAAPVLQDVTPPTPTMPELSTPTPSPSPSAGEPSPSPTPSPSPDLSVPSAPPVPSESLEPLPETSPEPVTASSPEPTPLSATSGLVEPAPEPEPTLSPPADGSTPVVPPVAPNVPGHAEHKGSKKLVVTVAILIGLILAAVAVFIYLRTTDSADSL